MNGNYASLFTRGTFVIADTTTVTHLTLAADYDDGFVAYINGVEAARRNLPPGPIITHTNTALGNHTASREGQEDYNQTSSDPQEKEFISIDTSLLVNGTNVLAVSGHNSQLSGSSDFSLIMELYTNVTLVRGPILQMPNPGRITVTWRTDAETVGNVWYSYDPGFGSFGIAAHAGTTRVHAVELPEFGAGSTVYYRVLSEELLAEGQFRAPPSPSQSFRFAVLSDFGSPGTNTKAIAHQISLAAPDLMLTSGDNVQHNCAPPGLFDSDWFGPLTNVVSRTPAMWSLGNHDIRIERGRWYLEAVYLPTNGPPGLAERNYSFDYGNIHVVSLDANAFVADGDTTYTNAAAQRTAIISWLTNDLATTTQQWKMAMYHHPHYTTPGSHADTALLQSLIAPVYEKYGVHIAFQGHNHKYERINPINGVTYVTVGSGGYSIHDPSTDWREFSAKHFNDKFDFLVVDVDGPRLTLRCIDQDGVQQDFYYRDLSHPFSMDGRLDSPAVILATNALNTIKLHAAIRSNLLYVAGQDAPPPANGNNDHFIYINSTYSSNRPANWSKAGLNMQWSAFLADESINGFVSWFGPNQEVLSDPAIYQAITPGFFENGTNHNGALEGTLQLNAHFGSFPTQLLVAFAPYSTTNGGVLLWEYQIPAATAGSSINSNEYLLLASRRIALDLPVALALSNQTLEAGMPATLDGSGSQAPSGFPLTYRWRRLSGPDGLFGDTNAAQTWFALTNDPAGMETTRLELLVHDTRFDSNDVLSLVFTPLLDSDNDGLSDQEETTGLNNLLTPPDPAGMITLAGNPDSDTDGQGDGEEAIAGTGPTDFGSRFEIQAVTRPGSEGTVLEWPAASNRTYDVLHATNLAGSFEVVTNDLPAVPPSNSYTDSVNSAESGFYEIKVRVSSP